MTAVLSRLSGDVMRDCAPVYSTYAPHYKYLFICLKNFSC